MSLNIKESRLAKLLNFKDDFDFDDIVPYDDIEYNDQYDDVIVGEITKFDDDFYNDYFCKDDFLYYTD